MDDIQLTYRYLHKGDVGIAVLVLSSLTGDFTIDSGSWDQSVIRTQGLLGFCLLNMTTATE